MVRRVVLSLSGLCLAALLYWLVGRGEWVETSATVFWLNNDGTATVWYDVAGSWMWHMAETPPGPDYPRRIWYRRHQPSVYSFTDPTGFRFDSGRAVTSVIPAAVILALFATRRSRPRDEGRTPGRPRPAP